MMYTTSRIAAAAAMVLTLLACEPRDESTAATEQRAAQVDDGLLAQLMEQFPTLREEPAPEPQPRAGADPASIPDAVEQAVPGRALRSVTGEATFYADTFEGRRTASGIPFRQNQMVAAHRAYPFGTLLRVTNLANGQAANVRVVDRGPFGSGEAARRTVIDLSRRAANQLGFVDAGRTQVRVEVLEWGEGLPRTAA